MSRPLRVEIPGATYHITSRGDRREDIYRDDADRHAHLDVLAQTTERFDAQALAYCLMGNHYHLVLHTRQSNLSRLMRHLNGVFTQRFNRRHGLVGHLFQGRFKAILVDRDAYLLTLAATSSATPSLPASCARRRLGRGRVAARTWGFGRHRTGWTPTACTATCCPRPWPVTLTATAPQRGMPNWSTRQWSLTFGRGA